MLLEWIEIVIAVQQPMPRLDAETRDQPINRDKTVTTIECH
jgi:hypothetical protein